MLDHLDEVIDTVSGGERYRFNARQLFYALRPIVMDGDRPGTEDRQLHRHHQRLRGRERRDRADVPRAARLDHPSAPDETITLGTLMVENYERPGWSFNKLLYIEKEGAQEALKQDRWLERHDCAVMSSKGFSTRAARDLIDKLVEHDEPIKVFCAHDADASGTMIYQTLQEATRARGARKIEIVNIGLEPWEAVEMGLEVETVEEKERRKPVADYVADHDGEWRLGRVAADPPRRTERHDHAATDRVARREDGRARRRQADPAGRGAGRGAGRADRAKVRAESPSASCARPGSTGRSPRPWRRSTCRTARRWRAGSSELFKDQPDAEWRDHIEAVVRKQTE